MFTNTTDKSIWQGFVRNIASQPNIVPLINYFAIKQAKYFIRSYYPDWNLKPMDDASFEAENLFNVERLNFAMKDFEHTEFLHFMY